MFSLTDSSNKIPLAERNAYIREMPGVYMVAVSHNNGEPYNYLVTNDLDLAVDDIVVVRNQFGLRIGQVKSVNKSPKINLSKYNWSWVIAKVDMQLDQAISNFKSAFRERKTQQDQAQFAVSVIAHNHP